uniref:Pacifastin-like protease inhibitor cvp4 n=1 Tax=Pimpla hypochondriaca TaxID=135724 RepID=CVP4_PIMHY|nr:RecName: Full=Pacifastin-like protease inhibitor cvp4; AltName: Full=Cysteine-rich venom protein 4; Flags: Precursor [Pimpla hypochondriaca]CAD27740.1 cysteine-rich venom protein 4 [Pimpla hypochondriaca]
MGFLACALLVVATAHAATAIVNPETCEIGSNFKNYCNNCYCFDGVMDHALCTRESCDRNVWNEDGTRKFPKPGKWISEKENKKNDEPCTPGENFKYYCNDCQCLDGLRAHAMCTRMRCDRNVFNEDGTRKYPEPEKWNSEKERKKSDESCAPGASFKYYCNSCTCGAEGKVAEAQCTSQECDRYKWKKDGSKRPFTLDPVLHD